MSNSATGWDEYHESVKGTVYDQGCAKSQVDVQPGDYVRDHMNNGELRKVLRVEGETVYMEDGGFMGRDECTDILLESEVNG